ncbi:MAG: hypothetical protein A3I05_01945 [Deltaproteobacteria bacterium RIFCSPLOWO2_02_FULL_44_10]|nr:MAG: hypothetical protein A3C46_08115 [Deltaproteobacteria bacterium RIFCSPHIGHO2_02_FULL_44_16]OGQ47545.1 MAG: hypothetical protein A3I05_01945 [Deltaproteobacteria bacterium RIFCSPLOWO2_02_FULL_44_10]
MRIYYNLKTYNNINILFDDPAIKNELDLWGKEGLLKYSSIPISIFETSFGTISLLYGPRQVGKTSSLKLFLSQMKDSETLIYTDCSVILDKKDLYQHLSSSLQGKTTLVLDEVQSITDWHLALRTLYSEGKLQTVRVWCTGSEARYLLESGERLPGRKGEGKNIFLRPWNFREFMDFFYPDLALPYRDVNYHHFNQSWLQEQNISWEKAWNEYLTTGGIPQVVGFYKQRQNIPDYVWNVYRDWLLGTWSKVRTPERSLSALCRRIMETMNSRVDYEVLRKGTDIQSANTVKTLMDMQEDHFSLRVLPKMDIHRKTFVPSKQKKMYPLDPFVARVFSSLGFQIRRTFEESLPSFNLDECAFVAQTLRYADDMETSYLYSQTSKAEIDVYVDECAFELKSHGRPSQKQMELLKACPQYFIVQKDKLPLTAYLVAEKRWESDRRDL